MSDNKSGARRLTEYMLASNSKIEASDIVFLGGNAALPATGKRIDGFREALLARGQTADVDQIVACGYQRAAARDALEELYDDRGRLPSALFINSIGCVEGAWEFLVRLPADEVDACNLGSFDYDPFGSLLRHPIPMVRQRAEDIMRRAYQHLDNADIQPQITLIEPELIVPKNRRSR